VTKGTVTDLDDDVCGWPREEIDVRVVDSTDVERPRGEIGEIVVRPDEPHVIVDGYYGNPEETVASCRNLWYHTDDLGYFDGEGRPRFVGRKGNSVRVQWSQPITPSGHPSSCHGPVAMPNHSATHSPAGRWTWAVQPGMAAGAACSAVSERGVASNVASGFSGCVLRESPLRQDPLIQVLHLLCLP
jgi:hypothetical protein